MTPKQLAERYGLTLHSTGVIHLPDLQQHNLSVSYYECYSHIYLDSVYFLANKKDSYPTGMAVPVKLLRYMCNEVYPKVHVILIEGI